MYAYMLCLLFAYSLFAQEIAQVVGTGKPLPIVCAHASFFGTIGFTRAPVRVVESTTILPHPFPIGSLGEPNPWIVCIFIIRQLPNELVFGSALDVNQVHFKPLTPSLQIENCHLTLGNFHFCYQILLSEVVIPQRLVGKSLFSSPKRTGFQWKFQWKGRF